MLVLVCHSLAWTLSNTAGPAISGHSTAVVRDRLYLFGGLLGSAGSAASNKTWVYDGIWEEVDASGPSRRMYSAAAELDDAVYIFGGWDPDKPGSGGTFKDDVWKFDTRRCTWKEVSKMPKAVSRHAACRVNDAIVVCTFRETLVYERGQLRVQPTSGVPPAGLSMCACSALNGELVVFGGATRTQEMTNDVYVLNTHNWTWRKQLTSRSRDRDPNSYTILVPMHSLHVNQRCRLEPATPRAMQLLPPSIYTYRGTMLAQHTPPGGAKTPRARRYHYFESNTGRQVGMSAGTARVYIRS